MRYMNREQAALLLILLACMLAECIPLMLVLVALSALILFLPNCQAITNFRGRLSKMYYKTCPHCGAHPDPGEICDCSEKEKGRPVREAPDGQRKKDTGYVFMFILEKTGEVVKGYEKD